MDHPFRSAPLGGFNKQDVLAFLAEQSKQAAQAQQQLQEQLEGANRQAETLRQEGEELRRRLEEAQRELETARQGRDSLSAQLEEAGREHCIKNDGLTVDEYYSIDGRAEALKLIRSGNGTVTPYGVVYDSGMELKQLYTRMEGRSFRTPLRRSFTTLSSSSRNSWVFSSSGPLGHQVW